MSHWSELQVARPSFSASIATPDIEVSFTLATPMLGGGVEAKKPDVDEPFRPTAVRNGIRFWWRRVWLANYTGANPLADLRKAEEDTWGSTNKPGMTTVEVSSSANPKDCMILHDWVDFSLPFRDLRTQYPKQFAVSYAWGVVAVNDPGRLHENPHVLTTASGQVRLTGTDPCLSLAVQFWLVFGGVGARTRRGFGVLKHSNPIDWTAMKSLVEGEPKDAPISQLGGARLLVPNGHGYADPMDAWAECLKPYADFRKGNLPGAGGRPYVGMNSHSRWPESDVLRTAQRKGLATHGIMPTNAVPRASLGLPMTLRSVGPGRVPETYFDEDTLEFGRGGRWPSPVITRPIFHGEMWKPCILILNNPALDVTNVHWKNAGSGPNDLDATNWPSEWWDGPWSHGRASAVNAFIEYATARAGWGDLP